MAPKSFRQVANCPTDNNTACSEPHWHFKRRTVHRFGFICGNIPMPETAKYACGGKLSINKSDKAAVAKERMTFDLYRQ
jgi:hypothetical protein